MTRPLLRLLAPDQASLRGRRAVDETTLNQAAAIIADVRRGGEPALRQYAVRLDDLGSDQPLIRTKSDLQGALASIPADQCALLERTAARIRRFAEAQRDCLRPLSLPIPGGVAAHRIEPVGRAGCYAPGGRFPLLSTVLMTVVTARVAGVAEVWVASPRPTLLCLAAAAVAGADALLVAGGAQAIAALAYGAGLLPSCDIIVGPGNKWVTAAKRLVAGDVAIDMLAGPSELVVLADNTASPLIIAADLLAQAEHDPEALPILVTTSRKLADAVDAELQRQLPHLPTAGIATASLAGGFAVLAADINEAIEVCLRLAPEHLEIMTGEAEAVSRRLHNYGSLFIGVQSAEALGDYGAGPNHVLPTGGTARSTGGLSVLTFLRVRTVLRIDDAAAATELLDDAVMLARLEGLEAHARSVAIRRAVQGSPGARR